MDHREDSPWSYLCKIVHWYQLFPPKNTSEIFQICIGGTLGVISKTETVFQTLCFCTFLFPRPGLSLILIWHCQCVFDDCNLFILSDIFPISCLPPRLIGLVTCRKWESQNSGAHGDPCCLPAHVGRVKIGFCYQKNRADSCWAWGAMQHARTLTIFNLSTAKPTFFVLCELSCAWNFIVSIEKSGQQIYPRLKEQNRNEAFYQ